MTRLEARARDGRATPLALGARVGKGGEGEVFADASRPDRVVKLFAPEIAARKVLKLAAMLARPPAGEVEEHGGRSIVQIAWPLETVHDAEDRLVGFTMRHVDFASTAPLDALYARSARQRHELPEEFRFRLYAARNLAALLTHLHAAGHCMVDTKPQNIRVYREGALVCLLDCDGYAIAGSGMSHPATVRTMEFLAPEAFGRPAAELGFEQDRFGLAVLIFELLANGVHPSSGTDATGLHPPDIAGRLERGLFFVGPHPPLRPPWNSTYAALPPATRALLEAALLGDPARRPSAASWVEHLGLLFDELAPCARDPRHDHLGPECPWCALELKRRQRAETARRLPELAPDEEAALSVFVPTLPARRWHQPRSRGHGRSSAVAMALQARRKRRRRLAVVLSALMLAMAGAGLATQEPARLLRAMTAAGSHLSRPEPTLGEGALVASRGPLPSLERQSSRFVSRVQQVLLRLGYAPGSLEGRLDPQTREAWLMAVARLAERDGRPTSPAQALSRLERLAELQQEDAGALSRLGVAMATREEFLDAVTRALLAGERIVRFGEGELRLSHLPEGCLKLEPPDDYLRAVSLCADSDAGAVFCRADRCGKGLRNLLGEPRRRAEGRS